MQGTCVLNHQISHVSTVFEYIVTLRCRLPHNEKLAPQLLAQVASCCPMLKFEHVLQAFSKQGYCIMAWTVSGET